MRAKRVLLVADEKTVPFARRYVRHFLSDDPADRGARRHPGEEISWSIQPAAHYKCFHIGLPQDLSEFKLSNYTAVHYWGLYDHILLQDAFLVPGEGQVEKLDSLPLRVAFHLFYRRGQFAAVRRKTVQPIILDPRLLAHAASPGGPSGAAQAAWLSGPQLRDDRERLRQAFDPARFWSHPFAAGPVAGEKPEVSLELPPSAFSEIASAVRALVAQGQLRLLMIDDDPGWLEIPYRALGGADFTERVRGGAAFWVLQSQESERDEPTLRPVETFTELRDLVSRFSTRGSAGLSAVVTDILFEQESDFNGLDVLRYLRAIDGAKPTRNVLIAYTGYASPLLTAACIGEGADFVVQKTATESAAGHGHAARADSSRRSETQVIEIFWNILWLRAASWFTCERLAQLGHWLRGDPVSAMQGVEAQRFVGEVCRDIEAVFPPEGWLKSFQRWRDAVAEALPEAAEYVYFRCDSPGNETKELRRWRNRLCDQLGELYGPLLAPSQRPR